MELEQAVWEETKRTVGQKHPELRAGLAEAFARDEAGKVRINGELSYQRTRKIMKEVADLVEVKIQCSYDKDADTVTWRLTKSQLEARRAAAAATAEAETTEKPKGRARK